MTSKVIAVTGGIGSGKSEVLHYLQGLGYNTLDCDILAREVSLRPQTVEEVQKLLGEEYIDNGRLNRSAIRAKVFSDKDLLQLYNSIFFDEVKKMLIRKLSQLNGIVFVEISVFDAFVFEWDEVWLIDSDSESRIERAMSRDGVIRKDIENIVSSQTICQSFSMRIINDGDICDLHDKINTALASLK